MWISPQLGACTKDEPSKVCAESRATLAGTGSQKLRIAQKNHERGLARANTPVAANQVDPSRNQGQLLCEPVRHTFEDSAC